MGDAAGVGPEVIVRAWSDLQVHAVADLVVLGHPTILREACALVGGSATVVDAGGASDVRTIPCLPVGSDEILAVPHGAVDGRTGQAAYEALIRAIDGTLAGKFGGIVTAPLSKAALHAAGHFYPGHTELLAERCGVTDFAMMLYLPAHELPNSPAGLGVAHVTLHMALRDVFANLNETAILEKCQLAHQVMSIGFGLAAPRIGVCALNPHGGEGGLFGDEESRIIAPAVEQARAAGIDAQGPFPTDTLMVRARDGEFDGIVAMYHDQGHIALKLLGMHRAVNITLGLPIVRTSVAHGTAFDRAWQGTAESTGMVAAITTAAELARRKYSA
jgi:4-hydroxythreonine-4-phosphate dehydrogenase